MFSGDGSVYLRGRQFGVAEKILDTSQIGTPFEKMRGVRMTESVGEGSEAIPDDAPDPSRVERPASDAHPESVTAGRSGEHRTSVPYIRRGRSSGVVADRDGPFLAPLPVHRDELPVTDVTDGHGCELRDPHPGSVENLEKCAIAKIDGIATVEIVEEPFKC